LWVGVEEFTGADWAESRRCLKQCEVELAAGGVGTLAGRVWMS
jgi:hypothetical protein